MAKRNNWEAIKYIKTGWKDGKTVTEIAALYRVDAGNLERAFKKAEGVTIGQFISNCRKMYVLKKIQEDHHFGYEIGNELGFADDLAFYRWVRGAFGISWRTLRTKIIEPDNDRKE